MKKKHLLIGLLIVIFSSYYAFKNVSIADLTEALRTVKYIYLIPAVLLVAITFLFRAMRWHYLVSSVKNVKTSRLFSPLMVGFMGNILPARAGEFIRAYLLGKKENVTFSAAFATIFVERLFDMLLFLMLLVGVIFFSADTFAQGENGESQKLMGYMIKFGWVSFIGSLGIFLFSVLLQYKNDWAMKIVEFCSKPLPETWREKIFGIVQSFTEGLSILKDVKGFLAALVLSFLVWISMILTYYPIHLAFGITDLPMVTSVLVVSLTIGIFISLFPTPGFLGAFQAACVVALHDVFGVSKAVAASYGIIAWLVAMGFIIAVGSIFIVRDNISFKELASSKEQG
ncbi:MAG: flippase-like domain-containing protein [Nitrospiraceae bacterium]|nr:MAG: flippase-like domain-containing protein [Nitrospiraceae bacterium]